MAVSTRPLFIAPFLIALSLPASAAFCGDYQQELVPGFRIGNAGSGCYLTNDSDKAIYLSLVHDPSSGPILNYAILPTHLLLRTEAYRGKSGDPPKVEFAPGKSHYFIVSRADERLRGPFSAADFETELAAIESSPIYWELPNKNASSSILCLLMLVLPILIPLILLGIGLRLLMERRFRRSR
jgi:hypothetical protein